MVYAQPKEVETIILKNIIGSDMYNLADRFVDEYGNKVHFTHIFPNTLTVAASKKLLVKISKKIKELDKDR